MSRFSYNLDRYALANCWTPQNSAYPPRGMLAPNPSMVLPSAEAPASHSHQDPYSKAARSELASPPDEFLPGSHHSTPTSPSDMYMNNALDTARAPTRKSRWGLHCWFTSRKVADFDNSVTIRLPYNVDVGTGPFAFTPSQLSNLVDPKDLDALQALGGVDGLLQGLGTHTIYGLADGPDHPPHLGTPQCNAGSVLPELPDPISLNAENPAYKASLGDRARVYGMNSLPSPKSKSIWQLMWAAYNGRIIVRSLIHPRIPFDLPFLIVHRSSYQSLLWSPLSWGFSKISVPGEGQTSRAPSGAKASGSWSGS